MFNFIMISCFLRQHHQNCISPKIEGMVNENLSYFHGEIITNEQLKNGTTISFFCNGNVITTTCLNKKWNPSFNLTYCWKPYCMVPNYLPNLYLAGASKGDVFKNFETVSFVCNPKYFSLALNATYGLSVCYKGRFNPPLDCYKKVCKIPKIQNGQKHDDFKFSIFVNGNLKYFCDEGFSPKKVSENDYNIGISKCIDGIFSGDEFPECVKMCHTSALENVQRPLLVGEGYITNNTSISFKCVEDYPLSINDIVNSIKSGIGMTTCKEGLFENSQVCFSGCVLPKNVISDKKLIRNGEYVVYYCIIGNPNDLKRSFCRNNKFINFEDCPQEYEKCYFENNDHLNFYNLNGTFLSIDQNTIYTCPLEKPISVEDLNNFNKGYLRQVALGYGKINCSLAVIPDCYEGCIVPANLNHKFAFVFKGENIQIICPDGKTPISENSVCVGPNFYPEIGCVNENLNRCYVPEFLNCIDLEKINTFVDVGIQIEVKCGGETIIFNCTDFGNFQPEFSENCFEFCNLKTHENMEGIIDYQFNDLFVLYRCQENYFSISHGLSTGIAFCLPSGKFYPEFECKSLNQSCMKPLLENTLSTNVNKYRTVIENQQYFEFQCQPGFYPEFDKIFCDGGSYFLKKCHKGCRIHKNQVNAKLEYSVLKKNFEDIIGCPGSPINGEITCVDGLLHVRNCKITCSFPKNVRTIPIYVEKSKYFEYSCSDGYNIPNIKCPGKYLPFCQKDLCVVPSILNALNYYVVLYNGKELELSPFDSVKNSSSIKINCGTYHFELSCFDGKWDEGFHKKVCHDGCKIKFIDGLFIENRMINRFVDENDNIRYKCNKYQYVDEFIYLTCKNHVLVGEYVDSCFGGCQVVQSLEYTLIDDYDMDRFQFGAELRYKCNGKFTGEIIFKCTNDGVKKIGKCSNECEITDYFFGVEDIFLSRLAENDPFWYTCENGMSPVSTNSYCIQTSDGYQIWPKAQCVEV